MRYYARVLLYIKLLTSEFTRCYTPKSRYPVTGDDDKRARVRLVIEQRRRGAVSTFQRDSRRPRTYGTRYYRNEITWVERG